MLFLTFFLQKVEIAFWNNYIYLLNREFILCTHSFMQEL